MRGVLSRRPSEASLLAIVMFASLVVLAGRIVQIHLQFTNPEDRLELTMQHTVSQMLFVPLAYYGMAALGTYLSRLCGGQGSWREGRAAFFWAALVAAPIIALSLLVPLFMAGVPPEVSTVTAQVGAVFFTWALAQCFAEAFGFARTWLVFASFCVPALLIFVVVWLSRS